VLRRLRDGFVNLTRRLRYSAIAALAGDMPVVLNVGIVRPAGFKGALFYFAKGRPAMIAVDHVEVRGGRVAALMVASRDIPRAAA
jgi:hypothetical protein